jgi:hypothetical protein
MELKTDNQCGEMRAIWDEGVAYVRFAIGVIMLHKSDHNPLLLWLIIVSIARYRMCSARLSHTSVRVVLFPVVGFCEVF